MKENDQKHYLAKLADMLANGKISRRNFLSKAAKVGLSMSALGSLSHLPFRGRLGINKEALAATQPSKDVMAWVKDVGKPYAGKTVRMATESTPPSKGIAELVKSEFTPATGIKVEIEVLPLEQVLQKLTLDVASGTSTYDLYYMDQSWMASFSNDTIDPRELYASNKKLAYPDYNFDDFLKPLVDGISMYKGKMVGVPYDIPIFIQMYRMDVYDDLGLKVATTMDQYLKNAQIITEKNKSQGIYGTTGQMKSGHYSLECDWTAWLWGHGGSVFRADGTFSGNDAEGLEAMDYWVKLKENMPSGVDTWTWDGEFQSVAQGLAGQVLQLGRISAQLRRPEKLQSFGTPRRGRAAQGQQTPPRRPMRLRRNSQYRSSGWQRPRVVQILRRQGPRLDFYAMGDLSGHAGQDLRAGWRLQPDAPQHFQSPGCFGGRQSRGRNHPAFPGPERDH